MTWKFKLRVTVGRAAVHNAKSIKLVNDIDLHHQPVDKENAPMLIVGFGKTFTVHDPGPKKLIMKTLARAAMETDRVGISALSSIFVSGYEPPRVILVSH